MKKQIVVTLIATLIGLVLGLNSDLVKAPVERIYCQLLPNECAGGK